VRYTAFLCCDLAALSPAAGARLYISSVLPLKIGNRRRQSEPAALLRLADQSPTVIFRCGQSSRLLTIAARSHVQQAAHFGPDGRAILCPGRTRLYTFRYARLIRFSFLILVHRSGTLQA
jgi:hypothetical protein